MIYFMPLLRARVDVQRLSIRPGAGYWKGIAVASRRKQAKPRTHALSLRLSTSGTKRSPRL
jgi:hypothetical protein